MIKDRVINLFRDYDEDVRKVIAGVIDLEQERISMDRPHVKDAIKEIIDEAVKNEA